MERLIVLGTGAGMSINCYSLSALLENRSFMGYSSAFKVYISTT